MPEEQSLKAILAIVSAFLIGVFGILQGKRKKKEAEADLVLTEKRRKQQIERIRVIRYCAELSIAFAELEKRPVAAKHVRMAKQHYLANSGYLGHEPKVFAGFYKAVKSHALKLSN